MRKVALFLLLIFVLALSSCFAWAQEANSSIVGQKDSVSAVTEKASLPAAEKKEPVDYVKRADKLAELEAQAKILDDEEAKANKYIREVSDKRKVLIGQYSVWLTMPDSILVKK